jgi:hypothetical protein
MAQGYNIPGHFVELVPTAPTKLTLPTTGTLGTLTGTETLTNKTLTSPTITNPTISGQTPVNITSATAVLGATHVGRVVTLNRATGVALTLPLATGTGSKYELVVATTFTGAATVVTAQTTDVMTGTAILFQDGGDTVVGFNTTNATTLSLFATDGRNGGIKGAKVMLTDIATNLWSVEYVSDAANTESTPFG